jgi:benzoyl-CoA reductase subunit B
VKNTENSKEVKMYMQIGAKVLKDVKDTTKMVITVAKNTKVSEKLLGRLETLEDSVPEKARIEFINYKHWCLNWFYTGKMGVTTPLPTIVKGAIKYTWIFDLTKANSMANRYVEGRSGANVEQVQKQLTFIVKSICDMVQYALINPDKVVLTENMVPGEILHAMGLHNIQPELPGSILPKCDQFTGIRYLDAAENNGLPSDTCGLPRFTTGVALLNEVPQGKCILASNLPCDGGYASYETIQQSVGGVPIYRLNVPYDFRNDESIHIFVDDLKGMIKFLEENTDGKMDWDKLRKICNNYNEIVECELERWELAKLDNPPLTNDAIWFPHYWNFNVASGSDECTNHYKKLLRLAQKAYKKGIPSFPNMKYRTVMWNPAPSGYGHMWNWLERCWGIGTVMDLETYGAIQPIDTSTPDTMLEGLGKRYMWATMSKHTRGPAKNMIEDLMIVIEDYKPDFVIYPAHVGCKNSMALESTMREKCKELDIPFCIFRYELLDNRVNSRQSIRDQVSKFMTEVMHAEPLDSSLLSIDDNDIGKW